MTSCLTVLGSCGGWPEPGRASSGFVVEHAGARVVLDLGYGTLPRLLSHLESGSGAGLDAVIITHRHPDHMVDLNGLFRARLMGGEELPPLPLFSPPDVVDTLFAIEPETESHFDVVFDWHELPSTEPHHIGPFELTAQSLPHFVPTVGVRLEAPDCTIAYSGDTGADPALVSLGRAADVFIVEATDRFQRSAPPDSESPPFLMTGFEAGVAAARAGARHLVLTHFWPGNDRDQALAAARESYTGPITIADEGLRVSLPL